MSGGEIYGNRGRRAGTVSDAIIYGGGTLLFKGGTVRNNTGREMVYTHNGTVKVEGGTFTENSGYALYGSGYGDGIWISGGEFFGNGGAVNAQYSTIYLSGNPVFSTEKDILQGMVRLNGSIISETDIRIIPTSYDSGTVVINGMNGYTLSESDVEKCSLHNAPERAGLSFDQGNNRVLLTYMTPVLVKVEVNEAAIVYDGEPVEPNTDFVVAVYRIAV